MKDNKICLAMIGFGGMANWHRLLIESGIEGLCLKGMYDIKPERQEVAKSFGYLTYDSMEDLLADEEVDLILCATPNDVHKDIVIKAMRAGKHAISEKPVCLSSVELQEIFDVADETGKVFSVHQNRRWDEDFLTIKQLTENGEIGPIFNIESRIHGSRGIPGDWRGQKEHGGGMILDWGVHIIDQALLMFDEKVSTVFCSLDHVTNELVDDGFHLTLQFESGKRMLLEVGTSNFVNLPRWYLQGRDGTAVIPAWTTCSITRVTNWDKNDAVPVVTAAGLTKTMAPRSDDTIRTDDYPFVKADIKDFYRNIIATIKGEETLIVQHAQMMRVMKLMEAAFESARLNQVLPFES